MVDVIGRAKVIVESDVDSTQVSGIGSKMGGLLSGALKVGAVGAATGIGALIGTTIFKGFQRLDAIDQAEAKLKGLGNSTKNVGKIMDNALAAVKGTAFGLGEAATVAAQLVAAGAKPGQALTEQLKSVTNLAAAAGISLADMGSIYAKAMTQANGVQNDVLGQLQDRGIPIYQKLAEQLNVTAGDVFELAKTGQISFEEFSAAAEAAGGTVADEMGNTVSGALANAGAAVGRLGAALLGKSFTTFPELLKAITKKLDDLEPFARTVGEKIGNIVDQIERWSKSKAWKDLKESMGSWGKDLLTVAGALTSIVKSMQAFAPAGQGKGLLDFLAHMVKYAAPITGLAEAIRFIQAAADKGSVTLNDVLHAAFGVPLNASGGPVSGLTIVGERGPELVSLPNGSYVHNNNDTKAMLAGAGGATNNFYITTGPVGPDLVSELNWLGKFGALANG